MVGLLENERAIVVQVWIKEVHYCDKDSSSCLHGLKGLMEEMHLILYMSYMCRNYGMYMITSIEIKANIF
jgi:hypothetical protein